MKQCKGELPNIHQELSIKRQLIDGKGARIEHVSRRGFEGEVAVLYSFSRTRQKTIHAAIVDSAGNLEVKHGIRYYDIERYTV
jgi:hypothetical protein